MLSCPKKNSLFVFLLVFFLFQGCAPKENEDKQGKSILYLNESNGISSLDPAFSKDLANLNVCNQLFNGLVQLDSLLHIQPAIAKSWTISNQGLRYTFNLRTDVYFHNSPAFQSGTGRKVVSNDFVYSFNRLLDPHSVSPGSWVFNAVKKENQQYAFEAPNDSTLIIELAKPFGPFIGLLSMQYCSVVPKEAIQYYGNDFRKHPVGTGPFYLKYWEEDVKLVLLKNPTYFEKENEVRLPHLDAVNYTFLVDKQSEFLEFIMGNLDYLSGIEPSFKDEILTENGALQAKYANRIRLQKSPYLNTEYIGIVADTSLPTLNHSPLKYLLFRQALQYAIDKEKMLRYLRNNIGKPGNRGILPSAFAFPDAAYGYSYNKQKAIDNLNKLKAQLHTDYFEPIRLVATSKSLDMAKYIQHQLSEIGIQMEIDLMQWATMKEVVANTKAAFFRGSWIADYPDPENYLSLFYSKNYAPKGPNYTHFSNETFDSLYNCSIFATNHIQKQTLYRQMDSLIMQQAIVIPLYYDEVLRFTQKEIKNLPPSPMNLLNLKWVRKETNKAQKEK